MSAAALAAIAGWLAERGPVLLLGTSIVLGGGLLAMLAAREPAARRRLGVLTALGCAVYLAAALVPMPRCSWPAPMPDAPPPAAGERPAPRRADIEELLAAAPRPEAMPDARTDARTDGSGAATSPDDQSPVSSTDSSPVSSAVSSTASSAFAPFPWPTALAGAWCAGVLAMALRLLLGALRVGVLLARSEPAPAWLARALPLPARTRLRLARAPVRPFCTGVLRPVIVLPPAFAARERSSQALAVLRHELAHVRANDAAVQLLFALLAVPLFCHPLFWLLRARVRFCAELLADDAAARTGVHAYVRQLLDLAADAAPRLGADAAVPIFHRPSEFYRRIQMLLQRETPLSSSPSRARMLAQVAFTAALVAGSAAFFGTPLRAQEPDGAGRRTAELRATIQSLQKEIDDLRATLQAMRNARADAGAADKARTDYEQDKRAYPVQDPARSDDAVRRLYDVLDKARNPDPAGDRSREKRAADYLAQVEAQPKTDPTAKTFHTVQEGDTLGKILRDKKAADSFKKLSGPQGFKDLDNEVKKLLAANPDLDTTRLRIGQKIALPETSEAPVASLFDALKTARVGDPLLGGSSSRGLAELTTRYLDLQGEVESAAIEAQELQQLAESGAASTREARQAQIRAATAKKKFAAVEKLLSVEIASTRAEILWLESEVAIAKGGEPGENLRRRAQLMRVKANLDVLESVRGGASKDERPTK